GRVEHIGVARVHRQVHRAGPAALVEHLAPGLTAIFGLEDAALLVRPPGVAERRDPRDVRPGGMDQDVADVARVAQADVAPGAAAVAGAVDAVAVRDVAADGGLAGAGVEDARLRGRDGDRADGGGAEGAVRDVLPVAAAAGRLPDAAGAGAEVEGPVVG